VLVELRAGHGDGQLAAVDHGRRLLAELERLARDKGVQRVRMLSTEVLAEARALYQSSGYSVISTYREDGRRDYWLEKEL
jgi:GNAT superfamily N-acetyltransferase